jgi:DNA-binding TFAR19-related protein (PDSD5 family)
VLEIKLEDDIELKLIEQKKLTELMRRIKTATSQKKEKTEREIVEEMLYDRGNEVLDAAYRYYPSETEQVVKQIAELIRGGKITEKISGGELYSLFRRLGLRFSLETSIKIEERGKLVDLSEKLRHSSEET